MKLLRDVEAYGKVVKDFVARQLSAEEFLPRFCHLWRCDGAEGLWREAAASPSTHAESALYGVLDSIHGLCETYSRSLPPGSGYRVSEEQFRKEIQRVARTSPLLEPRHT